MLDAQVQQPDLAMAGQATNVVPIREPRVIANTEEQALTAIAAHLHAGGIVVFVQQPTPSAAGTD